MRSHDSRDPRGQRISCPERAERTERGLVRGVGAGARGEFAKRHAMRLQGRDILADPKTRAGLMPSGSEGRDPDHDEPDIALRQSRRRARSAAVRMKAQATMLNKSANKASERDFNSKPGTQLAR